VDGVAPRAKMNQQRGRRFRSSLEAEQKRSLEASLPERYQAEIHAVHARAERLPAKIAAFVAHLLAKAA
jgi:5'-3' exonuclease